MQDLAIPSYTRAQKITIAAVLTIAGLIYCSISLVNHYLFRTAAYDLGIYNNILYSYAHLSINHTPIQYPEMDHLYGDHFEPILALISPLYYVFGTWTLLIVQIVVILAGAYGAMLYMLEKTGSATLSIYALGHFCALWGIYSALGFDYHNNVVAAMLVPWLFLFFHRGQATAFWIMLALVLVCKENMSLWMTFTGAGLAIHYRKDRLKLQQALIMSAVSAVYFVIVMKLIIPAFSPEGKSHYVGYYWRLGQSNEEILSNVFTRPSYIFSLLFENPSHEALYNGIKSELNFMVLFSGGIFLLYRPSFLVMLIPIFAQKLFIEDYSRWGINNHYSVEFVPILCFASFTFLNVIQKPMYRHVAFGLLIYITFSITVSKMDQRVSLWYESKYTRFYHSEHYTENAFDVARMHRELAAQVPEGVSVCAQSNLVPHLAFREKIYMYPRVNDAEYIVLAPGTPPYPFYSDTYGQNLDTLMRSAYWEKTFSNGELLLFKRR